MFYDENDSINELNLSARSCNALNRANILTIGALKEVSEADLREIKNLGTKSIHEILEKKAEIEHYFGSFWEEAPSHEIVPSFLGDDGITYQDIAIEHLGLSNRAYNCLKREHISFLSELLHLTYEEIKSWNKVGEKTVTEIIEKRDSYPLQPVFETADTANAVQIEAQQALCRSIAKRLSNSYKVDLKSLYEQISPLCEIYFQENPAETMTEEALLENPDFIRALSASPVFANGIQGKLLSVLNESVYGCTVKHLSEVCRPIPADTLEVNLRSLVATRQVTRNEDEAYTIKRMTAIEYAAQIPNQRRGYVLTERLHGRTLEDIGNELNVQRERIRQLERDSLKNRPTLYEDRYAEVFQKYDFSRDDFRLAFEENDTVFEYLKLAYKAGDLPPEKLMDDDSFPIAFRRAGERIAYKNCVQIGSNIVPCKRDALCDYALRQYAADEISFSSFVDKYHALLSDLGIADNSKLMISGRGYENKLAASRNVLWKQWKRLRYYPILLYDYTKLLDTLDLNQYTDIEISALKLFNEHAELMLEYDIRDEYELHNLLKKICTEEAYPNIQFQHMPTIEFGNFNRDQQVMDLLLSCAPVSKEDFVQRYEEEYGIKASSVKANYLGCIAAYLDGDTYRIDSPAMSDVMAQKLKGELTDDFYLLSELHEIYRRLFPDADRGLLNSYSITNLGFHIYSNYVVSGKYHSAVEYFRHILLDQDIVDISVFKKSLLSTITFCSQLYKLREEMEIVEFAPQRYIQIHKLNQAGIEKEDLRGFCKDVAEYVSDGEFFTVFSLQKAGFAHKLDEYGFDDWFYASLLAENKGMFSYQRMGGTRLFRKGHEEVRLAGLIEVILYNQDSLSMDIYDLADYLWSEYQIKCSAWKLIDTARENEMYYDSISEKIFVDYDAYFENI